MIYPSIDNPEVLRRVLLNLESRTIEVSAPISTIVKLPDTVVMADTVKKLNEIIETINAISTVLNSTRNNQF